MTSSEMGKASWAARKAKWGEKGAYEAMEKARKALADKKAKDLTKPSV